MIPKVAIRANDGMVTTDVAELLVPEGSISGTVIDLSVSGGGAVTSASVTAAIDDAVLTGDYIILDNSTEATLDITGIAGGVEGAVKWLVNQGNATINLPADSEESLEANRFLNGGSIAPFGKVLIYYNGTRWEIYG